MSAVPVPALISEADVIPIGYSYARFSDRKQKDGTSLKRQTHDTAAGEAPETWCARNGVMLDTKLTFRDLGKSAFTGKNVKHGDLKAFLDCVATGRVRPGAYLLVEAVDRITRQGVDEGMEVLKKILKRGVFIVTLGNGRVYGPESLKGLMKGLLELQMYLEQAHEYSVRLSRRIKAAWEDAHEKARDTKVPAGGRFPPWLAVEGEKDQRRFVTLPAKVEVVRRVFSMATEGKGQTQIIHTLTREGVPPLSGTHWARTSVRRLLRDRAVLGEHEPTVGTEEGRRPAGDVIDSYFPQVIDAATFHRAQSCLSDRDPGTQCRDSGNGLVNTFGGLLVDAKLGGGFMTDERVEKDGHRHHVLIQSRARTHGSCSFPYDVFEAGVLSKLAELDPRELLPPEDRGADLVLDLAASLAGIEGEIRSLEADLEEHGHSDVLSRRVRKLELRKKEAAEQLAEARLRVASPVSEAWGEAKPLLSAIHDAADPNDVRLRLRAILRRLTEGFIVLVVGRGRNRLAAVQVQFQGGHRRDYLIFHRPSVSNQHRRRPGSWEACSLSEAIPCGELDLRIPDHVVRLETMLRELNLDDC